MILKRLLIISTAFFSISSHDFHSFYFTLLSKSRISTTIKLDFSFDKILLSELNYDCDKDPYCKYTDNSLKLAKIYEQDYFYKTAIIEFIFKEEDSNFYLSTFLKVQISNISFSIFGVHQKSEYRHKILPNRALRFKTGFSEIVYSRRTQDDITLDWHQKNEMYYLKSVLVYFTAQKKVISPANLCFHDNSIPEYQNYFLEGDINFKADWSRFRKNNLSLINFVSLITFADSQKSRFELNYDFDIFKSYDLQPFKSFHIKKNEVCELFLGDFFLQRGGVSFLIENKDDLLVYIKVHEQPYSKSPLYRWQYTVRVILVSTLFYAVIFSAISLRNKKHSFTNNFTGINEQLNL